MFDSLLDSLYILLKILYINWVKISDLDTLDLPINKYNDIYYKIEKKMTKNIKDSILMKEGM